MQQNKVVKRRQRVNFPLGKGWGHIPHPYSCLPSDQLHVKHVSLVVSRYTNCNGASSTLQNNRTARISHAPSSAKSSFTATLGSTPMSQGMEAAGLRGSKIGYIHVYRTFARPPNLLANFSSSLHGSVQSVQRMKFMRIDAFVCQVFYENHMSVCSRSRHFPIASSSSETTSRNHTELQVQIKL